MTTTEDAVRAAPHSVRGRRRLTQAVRRDRASVVIVDGPPPGMARMGHSGTEQPVTAFIAFPRSEVLPTAVVPLRNGTAAV